MISGEVQPAIAIGIALVSIAITVASVVYDVRTSRMLDLCKCCHLRGNHFDDASACEVFDCDCCEFEKL